MNLFLLLLIIKAVRSIYIGTLPNVTYQPTDSSPILVMNQSCQECVCQAFFMNTSSPYVAFNCYINENRCELYQNYSASYSLVANGSSIFFFYPYLPPLLVSELSITSDSTSSTSNVTTTNATTIASISTLYWNSTAITVAGILGSVSTAANQFNLPYGLAFDSSDTLYIADQQNNRIQKWPMGASNGTTVAGQANGVEGTTATTLYWPSSVLVDSSDNIYVADTYNNRIQLWLNGSTSGTTIAGTVVAYDMFTGTAGNASNQLDTPFDIARDSSSGTLYIADSNNHRVMLYVSGASSGTVAAGGNGAGAGSNQLNSPYGIYFESSSNSLIIVNYSGNNVVRWVLGASTWTLIAGDAGGVGGVSSTQLNLPRDLTLDYMGNVYVVDTSNYRVQFFKAGQSNGTTIAGVTSVPGTNAILLNIPYSLALDSQLNLYVADTQNNRIQKFVRY